MKKILCYTMIYLSVTVLTAFGWVFVARPSDHSDALNDNNNAYYDNGGEITPLPEPPSPGEIALSQIMTGVMDAAALNLNFTVNVQQNKQTFALSGQVYLQIDLEQAVLNPVVQGSLTLDNLTVAFTYQDAWLYLTAFGGNYKISTTTFTDIVAVITGLTAASQVAPAQQAATFTTTVSETATGGFDLSQLMTELQQMTDTATDSGHTLQGTLLGVAFTMLTDADYHITAVTTAPLNLGDYTLTPSIQCAYLAEARVITVDADAYYDLYALTDWVQAVVNTAQLPSWHLTATLNVQLTKPLEFKMAIPLDIQIRLINGKPQIFARIGTIPVITGVNNDVPYEFGDTVSGINPGLNRMLSIYYADGYVYFYRSEDIPRFAASAHKYEKQLKLSLDEFLADPMLVLSYGCGFTDTIMNEITKAMSLSQNRETPINYDNIIKGLTLTPDELTVLLNLAELANNNQLGLLTLSLSTGPSDTDASDPHLYVTHGALKVNFPLSDAFVMDLQCNDLALVDIGTTLDWTAHTAFIDSYPYGVDEQWSARNGKWQNMGTLTHTVTFDSNGGAAVPAVSGPVDTPFDLKTLETWVTDDGETVKTYTFVGWYRDYKLTKPYTTGVIEPRDLVLYAKWDVAVQYYRNVTVVNPLVTADALTTHALTGTTFTLPTTFANLVTTAGETRTVYAFNGWYTDAAFTTAWTGGNVIPDNDVTLYAKWDVIDAVNMITITLVDNKSDQQKQIEVMGFAGDALDLTSFASSFDNWTYDDGTQTQQDTYTFAGFNQNLTAFPDADTTLYVNWECCETKYYYTVTFSKYTDDRKAKLQKMNKDDIVFITESVRILDGETLDLTQIDTPTWSSKLFLIGTYYCDFEGWTTARNGATITEITVTGDITLYANWSEAHKK